MRSWPCIGWRLKSVFNRDRPVCQPGRRHMPAVRMEGVVPLDTAFLDLAFRCAPAAQVETLAAIAAVESWFSPLPVAACGKPLPPQGLGEAVSRATCGLQAGKLVRAGLTGLMAGQAASYGGGFMDALDACKRLARAGDSLAAAQAAQIEDRTQGNAGPSAALEEFTHDCGADIGAAWKLAQQAMVARAVEAAGSAIPVARRPWPHRRLVRSEV